MTHAHLQPMEGAARILCQLEGIDADQMVPTPHPVFPDIVEQHPAWYMAAEQLLNLTKMLSALHLAKGQQADAQNQADTAATGHKH